MSYQADVGSLVSKVAGLLLAFSLASACAVNPVPTPGTAGADAATDHEKGFDSGADAQSPPNGDMDGMATAADATSTGADAKDSEADSPDTAQPGSSDTDTDTDTNTDTDTSDAKKPDGGDSVECCPMDTPGCDCVYTGGTKGPQGCMKLCDVAPVGWKQLVDGNGCPYWQAGPQTCMVKPVKCGENPPSFPTFTKTCQTDSECDFVIHQTDCCGNATAVGVWKLVKSAFESAELQCKGQYPDCGCASGPVKAEDGQVSATGSFEVACVASQCMTKVAKSN